MNETTARDLSVRGRVQGVGFRAGARREARRLGVSGWARNEADATVTVRAQGAPEAVAALERWCRRGPAAGEVGGVDASDVAVDASLTGFTTA